MGKLTKKEREIEILFRKLPLEDFFKIAKTPEQINALLNSERDYSLIAECWKSLHTGNSQPEVLRELPEDERYYIEELTVWFNEIWVLVWRTFPYIKEFYLKRKGFELPIKNSLEFFKRLTILYANKGIEAFFLPYKEFSHSKMQKAFKLCSEAGERKLNHTEVKKLNAVLNGLPENYWLTIAMAAWKENKNFKSDLESLVKRSGKICELTRKKTAKDRSFALVNGEKIYPSGSHGRNGYKLS